MGNIAEIVRRTIDKLAENGEGLEVGDQIPIVCKDAVIILEMEYGGDKKNLKKKNLKINVIAGKPELYLDEELDLLEKKEED